MFLPNYFEFLPQVLEGKILKLLLLRKANTLEAIFIDRSFFSYICTGSPSDNFCQINSIPTTCFGGEDFYLYIHNRNRPHALAPMIVTDQIRFSSFGRRVPNFEL